MSPESTQAKREATRIDLIGFARGVWVAGWIIVA